MSLISASRSVPERVNRFRVLDLLRLRLLIRVFAEHARQDQQVVERRAQLVRHVREEFRFVFRSQRQLFGLILQRHFRLFHFLILLLHFRLLLGQQLRFFLQLLIGLLQLFAPAPAIVSATRRCAW